MRNPRAGNGRINRVDFAMSALRPLVLRDKADTETLRVRVRSAVSNRSKTVALFDHLRDREAECLLGDRRD